MSDHDDTRDPIDDLRAGWRGVEPPEPGVPLEREPEDVRAVVTWMREAWKAVEAPAPRVPETRRRSPFRVTRSFRRAAIAAAAALLVAVTGVWAVLESRSDGEDPLTGGPLESVANTRARPGPPEVSPRVLVADETRIEIKSGPVRLVLVPETTDEP